jgi:hypothetical protein
MWYVANTGNHQGLVIDQDTGRNIAVAYDKEDAPLLAAAPDLLAACKGAQADIRELMNQAMPAVDYGCRPKLKIEKQLDAAIAKAEGG